MDNTSKLEVSFEPKWERKNGEDRACANLTIKYDNIIINPKDTVYTYYFDDKPVKSLLDVVNPSTGVHNFKVVVSYKGETKIVSKYLAYSKYGKVKVSDSNEPIKTKIKGTKPFISRKRFPFSTAEYGQVYYTNTIKVCNRNEGNYEEAQLITNTFTNFIDCYIIGRFDAEGTLWTDAVSEIDSISENFKVLSVILHKKTFIVKYNIIMFHDDLYRFYPNATFRTLVDPPKIIRPDTLYNYAVCRNFNMKAEKSKVDDIHGQPARTWYNRWKKIKSIKLNDGKYPFHIFDAEELMKLRSDTKKLVFKIRTESHSGNFSNWFYYYYNREHGIFIRIDKRKYNNKRNTHVAEIPAGVSVNL